MFVALLHVFAMFRFHVRFSDNSMPRYVALFICQLNPAFTLTPLPSF